MNKGFWKDLQTPIMSLAPMEDVTDSAFRRVIAKYGKPDVFYTEFVSTDGLCSEGRKNLMIDLMYDESERPVVAQIFGRKPEFFLESAKLITSLGFDGIDINFGCPEKKILKQKSCSWLINEPKLAKEIVYATKEGAGDLPVSVKTRIGFRENEVETWIPNLLETDPVVLTVHGRTTKQLSLVPADWNAIKRVREIRDEMKSDALVFGNGDVKSLEEAHERVAETGVDGVMIGRGIFGNPWLFNKEKKKEDITLEEKLQALLEHVKLFEDLYGRKRNFAIMKKHFKSYIIDYEGARALRSELMQTNTYEDVYKSIKAFAQKHNFDVQ